MSILLQIDRADTQNFIELSEGQYLYDAPSHEVINMTSGEVVYLNKQPLKVGQDWCNYFVLSPMSKVTLYDSNQSIQQMQYTGNTCVFYNYNTKKHQRQTINILAKPYADVMADNIVYIVVEPIENARCKRNIKITTNGVSEVFIDSSHHKYKSVDEPIISPCTETFVKMTGWKLAGIIMLVIVACIVLSAGFMFVYKHCRIPEQQEKAIEL